MNKITKTEETQLPIKVGNLYEINDEYYILSQFSLNYFLVNLRSGNTFDGFAERPEKSFGIYSKDFSLVDKPIILTPETNQ